MKKIFLFTFLLSIILSLNGCSNDQYAIERKYYYTQKQAEKIFNNPHASPPQQLNKVVAALSKFIKQYPKSKLAVEAEFTIARLYIVKEEFSGARDYLKGLLKKYKDSEIISSEALYLLGNSFELEDRWDSALTQYKKIMQDYPLTLRGINIPIYIAQHYKIKYQPDRMVSAYQEAISHYRGLAEKYPGSPLSFNAQSLVAQCYISIKEWQNAVNTFSSMLTAYKGKVNLDVILMEMALIYQKELKDNIKAKENLQKLLKEYPKSKLAGRANSLLKTIGEK